MATKNDPGEFDCYATLADDEPYFLLKGSHFLSPSTVRDWATKYKAAKESTLSFDARAKEKYLEAMQVADDMDAHRSKLAAESNGT